MNAIALTVGAGGKAASSAGSTAPVEQLRGGFADAIKAAHAQFAPVQNDPTSVARPTAGGATPQTTVKVNRNVVKPAANDSAGDVGAKAQPKQLALEEGKGAEEENSDAAGVQEDGARNAQPDVQPQPQPELQLQVQVQVLVEMQLQTEPCRALAKSASVKGARASATIAGSHAKESASTATGAKNSTKHEVKSSAAAGSEVAASSTTAAGQSEVGYAAPASQAVIPAVLPSKDSGGKAAATVRSAIAQAPSEKQSVASAAAKQEPVDPQSDEKGEAVSVASSHVSERTAVSRGEKVEASAAAGSAVDSAVRSAAPSGVVTAAVMVGPSGMVQSVKPGAALHLNMAPGSGSASAAGESGELTLRSYEAATPRRLEVGLSGGSFGWLNVRAEMGADGGVQATLHGSAETAGALRSQAGELQSFLAGQSVQVNHVSIEAGNAKSAWGEQGSGSGAQPQQHRQQRPQADAGENGAAAKALAAEEPSALDGVSGNLGAGLRSGTAIAGTGGWLSVRA